jgi:hypothetical protein
MVPARRITRLNKGLRRRADKKTLGFKIDPVSGYWAKNEDEDETPIRPLAPAVDRAERAGPQERAALHAHRHRADPRWASPRSSTRCCAASRPCSSSKRARSSPSRCPPATSERLPLYEATEGGAGVLTRLVAEPDSLAAVARKALQVMHFDVPTTARSPDATQLVDQPGTACVAACYRCLMSYYNQPDHELIDRRDEARGRRAAGRGHGAAVETHRIDQPASRPDPTHARHLARGLAAQRVDAPCPAPDAEPLVVGSACRAARLARHYVAAVLVDASETRIADFDDLGFEVVASPTPATWDAAFDRLATPRETPE